MTSTNSKIDAIEISLKQLKKTVKSMQKCLNLTNKQAQQLQDELDELNGKPKAVNRKVSVPNDQLRINHEPSKNGMGILVKYDEYTSKLTRNKSSKNRSKRKLSDESTTNEPLADTHKRRSKRLKRRRLNKCNNNNNIVDLCSD